MFNALKQKLLERKKFTNYFRYAIGEIILIVLGILIAVYLNNWNREKQNATIKNGIYKTIANNLKSDTTETRQLIEYYKGIEPIFLKIMNDSLSSKDLKAYSSFGIMTSQKLLSLDKRGYSQLSGFINSKKKDNDTLSFEITNFYSTYSERIAEINEIIRHDIIEMLKHWRDRYPWFRKITISREINANARKYLTESMEYKNKVAYRYVIVYENYVPALESFLNKSNVILKEIECHLESD